MRVIAGKFRSRQLKSLKGLALRPTSDRLRETLFNVLAPRIEGARFIDAFAGTGAVGIEAVSRGAPEAVFIENHPHAAALIQKNLDSLEIRSGVKVIGSDALSALQRLADLDPASFTALMGYMSTLERHYLDMCDIEFTIERSKLWMLQTRVGKRSAAAAFVIAASLAD